MCNVFCSTRFAGVAKLRLLASLFNGKMYDRNVLLVLPPQVVCLSVCPFVCPSICNVYVS